MIIIVYLTFQSFSYDSSYITDTTVQNKHKNRKEILKFSSPSKLCNPLPLIFHRLSPFDLWSNLCGNRHSCGFMVQGLGVTTE